MLLALALQFAEAKLGPAPPERAAPVFNSAGDAAIFADGGEVVVLRAGAEPARHGPFANVAAFGFAADSTTPWFWVHDADGAHGVLGDARTATVAGLEATTAAALVERGDLRYWIARGQVGGLFKQFLLAGEDTVVEVAQEPSIVEVMRGRFRLYAPEGDRPDSRTWVVVNGDRLTRVENVAIALSAPASAAFLRSDGEQMWVEWDGKAWERVEAIEHLSMSPDGAVAGAIGRNGTEYFAFVGGRKVGPYERVGTFVYSETGGTAAAIVTEKGRQSVLVGDKAGRDYDAILTPPTVSRNGKSFAYLAKHKDKELLVVGTTATEIQARPERLYFDEAGKRFAFATRAGDGFTLTEGKKSRAVAALPAHIWFAPKGSALVTLAGSEMRYVIEVDGAPTNCIDAKWLEEGRVIWARRTDPAVCFYVVEGTKLEAYDEVVDGHWAGGAFTFAGRRGSEWYVVTPSGKQGPFEEVKFAGDTFLSRTVGGWRLGDLGPWKHVTAVASDGARVAVAADGRVYFGATSREAAAPMGLRVRGAQAGFGVVEGGELWWRVMNVPE